jgi:uncharacterized protein
MIRVVLDTHVQSPLGSASSMSSQVMAACFQGRFVPVFSDESLEELLEVMALPRIRMRHGMADAEILSFLDAIFTTALFLSDVAPLPKPPVEDVTDTKFLSLASAANANFLVTNDRRHLLPLRTFGSTRIVTPAKFLDEVD